MNWRTLAIAGCWLAAAGWGIYYLIVMAGSSPAYVGNAVAHFIIGYLLARALMARPLTMIAALLATFAAGAYVRLALAFPGPELFFAPLGLAAAVALSDLSARRNVGYSAGAFVLGFIALIWLVP